ncbi:MAG: 4Fe-4S binding protein [Deltaproteobacteria bacterium]|nr:4Fe-4S binding protein [Deltaproteobacteria bacterium]
MPQYGWHVNIDNCIACRACEGACKQEFMLPTGVRRRQVIVHEGASNGKPFRAHLSMACMHCASPACMTACPVGRYWKDTAENEALRTAFGMNANAPTGLVLMKPSKAQDPVNGVDCIGCKRCMSACPYGAIEFDETNKRADKCIGCYHRLFNTSLPEERRKPACVVTCTSLALHFDDLTKIDGGAYGTVQAKPGIPGKDITDPNLTKPSVRFTPQRNIG